MFVVNVLADVLRHYGCSANCVHVQGKLNSNAMSNNIS